MSDYSRSDSLYGMFKFFIIASFCSNGLFAQDSFVTIGTHPGASAQSTSVGKQIATLFPWKGKLYAGYGDYGANSGPIDIYAFDPDSQKFTFKWEANTEAIYTFRAFNGRVFAPAIDRKSYSKPGDYTMLDTNGVWGDYNFGSSSTHVFDVAVLNDTILYMVGSQEERAAVWESKDHGATWKTIHYDTAISGIKDDFARYYFAGTLREKLYVQAVDYYGSLHPYSDSYRIGMGWDQDTSLFGNASYGFGNKPDTFAGKMVFMTPPTGPNGYSSLLREFDGDLSNVLSNIWVFDFVVDSNYLYALVDSGFGTIHVKRTADLIYWQTLARADYGCRSLAIMNDKMYIGMNDSRIMEYSRAISEITTVVPQMSIKEEVATIFPNPGTNIINIAIPWASETISSIIDFEGRVLWSQIHNNPFPSIDISFLVPGLYILKLECKETIQIIKFYKN